MISIDLAHGVILLSRKHDGVEACVVTREVGGVEVRRGIHKFIII